MSLFSHVTSVRGPHSSSPVQCDLCRFLRFLVTSVILLEYGPCQITLFRQRDGQRPRAVFGRIFGRLTIRTQILHGIVGHPLRGQQRFHVSSSPSILLALPWTPGARLALLFRLSSADRSFQRSVRRPGTKFSLDNGRGLRCRQKPPGLRWRLSLRAMTISLVRSEA